MERDQPVSELDTERNQRVDGLERRIAALEAHKSEPGVRSAGVHEHGKRYDAGNLCTLNGSLWLAVDDTADRPGKTSSWRLIAKGDRS